MVSYQPASHPSNPSCTRSATPGMAGWVRVTIKCERQRAADDHAAEQPREPHDLRQLQAAPASDLEPPNPPRRGGSSSGALGAPRTSAIAQCRPTEHLNGGPPASIHLHGRYPETGVNSVRYIGS